MAVSFFSAIRHGHGHLQYALPFLSCLQPSVFYHHKQIRDFDEASVPYQFSSYKRLFSSFSHNKTQIISSQFHRCTPHAIFHVCNRSASTLAVPSQVSLSILPSVNLGFLTLSRAEARNALSKEFLAALNTQIENLHESGKLSADGTQGSNRLRGLLIWSDVPGTFCAGADLKERQAMRPNEIRNFVCSLRESFLSLEKLPFPTIACIDGVALGGGLELALACDFRVASRNKTLVGLPETSLAIIPGAGGTQRLPRLVGRQKAKFLIFTARKMNATEALQHGIVDFVEAVNDDILLPSKSFLSTEKTQPVSVFPSLPLPLSLEPAENAFGKPILPVTIQDMFQEQQSESMAEAATRSEALLLGVQLMRHILPMGPVALRAAKNALREGMQTGSLVAAMDVEKTAYDEILYTRDREEALLAFKEKRAPQFRGH